MKSDNKLYKFKSNDSDITLAYRDEVKVMNTALTQQTSRNIDILSKHLDSGVFDNADFIGAIKQLSISSKMTKVRILIKSSEAMRQNSPRMVELIQLLTSSIEVRIISEEYQSFNEAFNLYDGKGVIYLRYADRYNGFANFNRPRLVTELTNFFNEVWEHSEPDSNLRRLHV
ncbi:MAG: hypothetical protein QM484_02390 [Woeseiaceae bacterium]